MAFDVLLTGERKIRGMDTNSLLRMYDLARDVITHTDSQLERSKADRAAQRVLTELRKRNVPFATGR
jgi:hypothetical protein